MRRRVSLCLAVLLSACAAPPHDGGAPSPAVKALFVDGLVLLEGSIGGERGWWILDSGYEYSLLDSAGARRAGLVVSTSEAVAAPGGTVSQGWARSVRVALDRGEFSTDSVAVMDLSGLAPVTGQVLAGLLGHDFFVRYVVTIDYATRAVRLAEPATYLPPTGAVAVPVWIEAAEPFAPATLYVGGRTVPAKLKLDTGSLSGLGLNGSFVAQNRLIPDAWPRRAVEGTAVGGATRNLITRIDSMAFGGVVIPQPVTGWSEDLTRVGDAGTLGAPILARFTVTFDYAHRRLLLEPQSGASARQAWDASGMLLVQPPGGDVLVAQVLPDTPAGDVGIAAGDVLVSIDRRPTRDAGLDSLRRYFRHPGRRDTLVLVRSGRTTTAVLTERPVLP